MNEKVNRYYDLAYGKRDELNPEEAYYRGRKDRMFILHNLEEIEAYYEDCMRKGSREQQKGLTEEQIVQDAIQHIKVDRYYDLAYGKRDELNPEEAYYRGRKDRMFILHNLEAIEAYYEDCMREGSVAQQEGLTEQQILQEAIESVSKKISVQKIGQATKDIPTTAKKEAKQVEETAGKTRNSIEEGAEVGDDN